MALGAEMSLESRACPPRAEQEVLANLEINDRCAHTRSCGATCYLNAVHIPRPPLSEETVFDAACSLIQNGSVIRHLAIPGKEPFESPALLKRISEEFHKTPSRLRPASLGVISASEYGIRRWLPKFSDTPLCWLACSVDVIGSGLRAGNPLRVLDAAAAGKKDGGTKALAVNTTFKRDTIKEVMGLARDLAPYQLDQWALCPLMMKSENKMVTEDGYHVVESVVERLGKLTAVAERVVLETDSDSLRRLIGQNSWRQLKTNVWRIGGRYPFRAHIIR